MLKTTTQRNMDVTSVAKRSNADLSKHVTDKHELNQKKTTLGLLVGDSHTKTERKTLVEKTC